MTGQIFVYGVSRFHQAIDSYRYSSFHKDTVSYPIIIPKNGTKSGGSMDDSVHNDQQSVFFFNKQT
jgi:hypothetical protein